MATTLELFAPSGISLTVELYPYDSDTIANTGGDTLTEATNRKGLYTATVAETLNGWYTVHVKLAGAVIAVGDAYVVDGVTCRVRANDNARIVALESRIVGTLAAGTHNPQSGDAYAAVGALDWTARAILSGTVAVVTSNSDFTLTGADLSSVDDQYNKCWLVFHTGNNKGVGRLIGDYTGATKRVQFTGGGSRGVFPSTVVAGDSWYLMPNTDVVAGIIGVAA